MLIVAGITMKNLKPRIWDVSSPYYLSNLKAVMISYADFYRMPIRRRKAMEQGIHHYLGIPKEMNVYLDNGAFYFMNRSGIAQCKDYEEFVAEAKPNWYAIPQESIPIPGMDAIKQRKCLIHTMKINLKYHLGGYIPVIHIGQFTKEYIQNIIRLRVKSVAIGGIVPNLLRAPKAMPYKEILNNLIYARKALANEKIHIFGIGGTATLHLSSVLGIDSVDSSGWRNRAARGVIQLPGSGDRVVAELGKWRVKKPSNLEWEKLNGCSCPACRQYGISGLQSNGITGFCNRATHNLWILFEEAKWIESHLSNESYIDCYRNRLDNSTFRPLIDQVLKVNYPTHKKRVIV